jgi:hypothetical protein
MIQTAKPIFNLKILICRDQEDIKQKMSGPSNLKT